MIRHCVLVLNFVARIAIGRKALELPDRQALMARIALHCRVSTDQRKSVLVLLNGGERDPPPFHRVTLIAGRSKLPTVNIGVAIRAACTDVAEDQAGMTLHAAQVGVTPA